MVELALTALYVTLALTVIGWIVLDVRERRLARDTALHQQKLKLYQDLDIIVRNLVDAVSTMEFIRTVDLEKKDQAVSSYLKLVGIPFSLGRDAVYTMMDELEGVEEPKKEKQFREIAERMKNVVLVETTIAMSELSKSFGEILSRLEYVKYGADIRTHIQTLIGQLSDLQTSSGAAIWYESIGLKGLVQPPKLEDWTTKVESTVGELRMAMKNDLAITL